MTRRRLATVPVALLALVAGLEWRRVFDGGQVVGFVAGAALLPWLVAVAATARRRLPPPLPVTGTLSVAALVAYALGAVLRRPDSAALLDGLLQGWSRILTTTLPVPSRPHLLLLPVALTWVAVLVGVETVLRSRRPALGVAAPVAAYAVALLFGVDGPGSRLVPATVALAAGLAAVAVLGTHDGRATVPGRAGRPGARRLLPSRRAVHGAVVVAVCAAAAAGLAPRLPLAGARAPYDPREAQSPPADRLQAIDPMSLLAGWAKEPAPVLFTVRADRAERWRLTVLDRYDPATGWSSDGELLPAGTRLPEPASPDRAADALVQEVTIDGLAGAWLPAAERPVEITGVEPLVDVDTGVLAHRGGLGDGLRYRVVSSVPGEEPDCTTATAAPMTAADTADALPPDLVALTQDLTADATSPCARAQAIADHLTSADFEVNTEAPSGSTLGRIRELLQPQEGPGLGTSEQFATAFVLMARAAGLSARVVVGFHGGEAAGGTYRVHAGDAFAWAEVRFDGVGWVAFDPTPVPGDQSPPPELVEEEVETAPAQNPATTTTTAPPVVEREVPPAPVRERSGGLATAARIGAVALGVLAGVVAVVAAAVALVRRGRRQRRAAAPDPAGRVVGAWRQCLDELRAAGVPAEPSDTAADCVARSQRWAGHEAAAAVAPVAHLANGALFGGPPVSEGDAAAAWRCADELARQAAARRTAGDRVRRALDVRVLAGR